MTRPGAGEIVAFRAPARVEQARRRRLVDDALREAAELIGWGLDGTLDRDEATYAAHRALGLAVAELCRHGPAI